MTNVARINKLLPMYGPRFRAVVEEKGGWARYYVLRTDAERALSRKLIKHFASKKAAEAAFLGTALGKEMHAARGDDYKELFKFFARHHHMLQTVDLCRE